VKAFNTLLLSEKKLPSLQPIKGLSSSYWLAFDTMNDVVTVVTDRKSRTSNLSPLVL
jgi:hypothetical protein